MKTRHSFCFLLCAFFLIITPCTAQIPGGFNYQAVARDGSGNPVTGVAINVRLSILTDTTGFYTSGAGSYLWEEQHNNVLTNAFGLFTIVFGDPSAIKVQGSASTFGSISWTTSNLFIGAKIFYQNSWKIMGSTKLWAVPYSMISGDLAGPVKKLAVTGQAVSPDSALFEVKNKGGQTVFAVYNEGVRIYVDDGIAKGTRGGFAIGGFGTGKAVSQPYFVVDADSIRAYIDNNPVKATRGGFAIGGFDKSKAGNSDYLDVATDPGGIVNPAQNRVLWYPLKNAFLAGNIIIEHPDSVGINSFSTGYQSRAKGSYSQAMGYVAVARGNYSTSIGRSSVSNGANSFAFGNQSKALANDSYAFGTGAKATGNLSFALGSVGVDSTGAPTGQTIASGMGAFALGFGSIASAQGSFTFGVSDSAAGPFSLAMGYATRSRGLLSTTMGAGTIVESPGWCATATGVLTKAGNWAAVAFGDQTYAKGHTSFATGFKTTAGAQLSSTFGDQTTTSGYASVAMGYNTTAQAFGSLAIGRYNLISGATNLWNAGDPVLVIGNGTSAAARANAMTVYKSGAADLASSINLNTSIASGIAMYVNDDEALWYNGTTYSWGFGGTYNVFARPVSIGTTSTPGAYALYVVGNAFSTVAWSGSDIRWKRNISALRNTLDGINQLNAVNYEWRRDEFPALNFDKGVQIGLVAQDVEKIFPVLVKTDNNGYKAVSYEKLSVVLLEGMKEQQQQIESVKRENAQLKSEIDELKTLVNTLIVSKPGLDKK